MHAERPEPPPWNPAQYLRFAAPRLQPAIDLLARVDLREPRLVCDLGAGAGNVTRLLHERWPRARIQAIDSSRAMLDRARTTLPEIEWIEADLARWKPERPVDLVFSNAALHWLDHHEELFPALLDALAPGGVFAVQMPRNHGAPSHRAIAELARDARWRARLEPLLRETPVAEPARYYDWLAPRAERVDLWETEYLHALEGADPVLEWTKGSTLTPLLPALGPEEREAFERLYAERLRAAYPRRSDGTTLFPFRRLFLVAVAPGR